MPDTTYRPGQRWISTAEPELGLGILTQVEARTLTLRFLACDETRTYAKETAPVSRVKLEPRDPLETINGDKLEVLALQEQAGLITYHCQSNSGEEVQLDELELSHFMHFSRPQDRLLTGQIDKDHWFDLRLESLQHRQRLSQNELIGLGGARTELLQHQLHIAREAGRLPHPRILLADEVGLGKTIEACLILHHLLLSGQATRALILVPSPLLHQWLVELMRRFNLQFSLFDEERCQAIEQSDQAENPFLAEQLVLCSLDLLTDTPNRLDQALRGEWDILIVDEAHHLEWENNKPSQAYQSVEALSQAIPSVLLLTATPEQLGRAGHFARLRLLDPDRYFSLDSFLAEEERYHPVAEATARLVKEHPLSMEGRAAIMDILDAPSTTQLLDLLCSENSDETETVQARNKVVRLLLDRYGPGRAIFRNTRERVKGLGKRELHDYPLPLPEVYASQTDTSVEPMQQLSPERLYSETPTNGDWWLFDPRLDWLIALLKDLQGEKLLLICAHADTAIEIADALRQREGIQAALFNEQMSIVERDRAAAWFADLEQGCQLLICSEIGSEGRNFQFAHHLALFDLPADPDLLEQRIGRLDRIGQREQIRLHTPYFQNSAQEVLFRWYNEGLKLFNQTCPAGSEILNQLRPALIQSMEEAQHEPEALEVLIATTQSLYEEISNKLKQGRDHLLELNSCPDEESVELISAVGEIDQSAELQNYMGRVFDTIGIETEHHTARSIVIKPSSRMMIDDFPTLPEEGVTATYQRATALAHENWHFLTWEHPIVSHGIEGYLDSDMGNSSVIALKLPGIKGNPLMLELLFVLECSAPKSLQAGRFLPPTLIRTVVDQNLSDMSETLTTKVVDKLRKPLEKNIAKKIIQPLRERITSVLKKSIEIADEARLVTTREAVESMERHYLYEIERLEALRKINPNIRSIEIETLRQQSQALSEHMSLSRVRLDSVRMIVGV